MNKNPLQTLLNNTFTTFEQVLNNYQPQIQTREIGIIKSLTQGIANISGLPNVKADELLRFSGDILGIAFNLDANEIGVILLGNSQHLAAGQEVQRTGRVLDVPVGEGLLGRVLNVTGQALDNQGAIQVTERRPVERQAAAIMDRAPVTIPLQTGIKVVDALVPIGRGQRELIVGDRQIGKTAIATDTIINQKQQNVICIYCAIGKRASSVAKVIADLRHHNAMDYTIVVVCIGGDIL